MTDKKTALELADWLAHMRRFHEDSIARNDPHILEHVRKLLHWERMARDITEPKQRSHEEQEQFCKFCGQTVIDPCVDEADLLIYRHTVERCSDAGFAHDAEAAALSSQKQD